MKKIIARLVFFLFLFLIGRYLYNNEPTIRDTIDKIIPSLKKDKKTISADNTKRINIQPALIPKLIFNHTYEEVHQPVIMNLNYKPDGTYVDVFIQGLRWKCITDAVEDRYNLPHGFIFAMMLQETNGIEFLLNSKNDGGAGLCHMQPDMTHLFGLVTYNDCNEHICFLDALALRKFIYKHRYERALLARIDERLDHVKNLDAAGRMIAYYMSRTSIDNGPLRSALRGYTGTTNYEGYWKNVKTFMNLLNDSSFLKKVEKKFNKINPNLIINGKHSNFQGYLESYRKLADNYGLEEYKALPKYLPKNSEIVKRTYKNYLGN